MQMLKTAVLSLPTDFETVTRNVTELALEAILAGQTTSRDDPHRLQKELDRAQQKKEAVMDAYFSHDISKEDMVAFLSKYEQQQNILRQRLKAALNQTESWQDSSVLRSKIQAEITSILYGEADNELFYKTLLQDLTVFKDRHMELRLNWLPQVFHFAE